MQDNRFYINLPVNETDQSYAALVRHAYRQLMTDVGDKGFSLNAFNYVPSHTGDDSGSIYVDYDVEDSVLSKDADAVNQQGCEVGFLIPFEQNQTLNCCKIKIAHDLSDQSADLRLLNELIITLRSYPSLKVTDMMYHSLINERGENVPEFAIYFSS